MITESLCSRCGRPIPVGVSNGACPVCGANGTPEPEQGDETLGLPPNDDAPIRTSGQVFGDYELLGEIAHGAMGVVLRARQISLNRLVALKMIRTAHLATPAEVLRFQTEAEAAAAVYHPHIVPIYEIGDCAGQHYFSMQLIEGESLAEALARGNWPRGSRAALRQTATLVAQVARGVQAAHQQGILHRDLKPGNILLDRDGQPHVTDFGLARLTASAQDLTHSGQILGTPSYMSPEQAAGRNRGLTIATDIYSLGAILYELLIGTPPITGDSLLDLLQRVQRVEPAWPSKLDAKIDADLATICMKCLQKEPEARYQTASALAEELDRWLRGEPILARPLSQRERFWRWCRRNPTLAGMALGMLLSLGMAAGLAMVSASHQREAAEQLQRVLQASEEQGRKARSSAALLLKQRGIKLLQEENTEGLVWLTQALELIATDPAASQLELRQLLTAYGQSLGPTPPTLVHEGPIHRVTVSPDGRYLLTASADGTARVWDATTYQIVHTLKGHQNGVLTAGFSPDGQLIFTGSADKTARLWNTRTGGLLATLVGHPRAVSSGGFSPDGRVLAVVCGNSFFGEEAEGWLWEVATGRQLGAPFHHERTLIQLAFTPDSRCVVTAGKDKAIRFWDAATGAPQREPWGFPEMADWRSSIALSPDGTEVAVGSANGQRGHVAIYGLDSKKRRVEFSFELSAPGLVVAFSGDGNSYAVGTERWTHFYDRDTSYHAAPAQWLRDQNLMFWSASGTQLFLLEAYAKDGLPWEGRLVRSQSTDTQGSSAVVGPVRAAAGDFRRLILAVNGSNTWPLIESEPLQDDLLTLRLWAERICCKVFHEQGYAVPITEGAWQLKGLQLVERLTSQPPSPVVARVINDEQSWCRHQIEQARETQRWHEALPCLDRLLAHSPHDRGLLQTRSTAYQQLRRYAEAKIDADRAMRLELGIGKNGRQTPLARDVRLALVALSEGKIATYRQACLAVLDHWQRSRKTSDLECLFNLSILSPAGSDIVRLILPDLQKIPQQESTNRLRLEQMGAAYFRLGQHELALARLFEAIQASPQGSPRARLFLALAYLRLGELDKARGWYEEASRAIDVDRVKGRTSGKDLIEQNILLGEVYKAFPVMGP